MGRIIIPSIETPVGDVRSLQNAVQQLKEAVEIMAGVRGDSPFLLTDDVPANVGDRLVTLERKQWKTIKEIDMTTGNVALFNNLSGKRRMRLTLYACPLTVADNFDMVVSLDNGATWMTSGTYTQILQYTVSSTPTTVSGGNPGTGLTAFNLNYSNGIIPYSSNKYGFSAVYEFDNEAYFKYRSQLHWYRNVDTSVLVGADFGWAYTATGGTGVTFNAFKIYTRAGNNFRGHFILDSFE